MSVEPKRLATTSLVLAVLVLAACSSPGAPATSVALSPTVVPTATVPSPPTVEPSAPEPAVAVATGQPTSTAVESRPTTSVAQLGADAMSFLTQFTLEYSPRESATEEELKAAEFLLQQFRNLGYRAELQPFSFDTLSSESRTLAVTSPSARKFNAIPMALSGEGRVSSPVADVGDLVGAELAPGQLQGQIALVERGTIPFQEKVDLATGAGAKAVAVYNDRSGLFRGQLTVQASVPVVSISRSAGSSIKGLMSGGSVEITVTVAVETLRSRNVVAEMPGTSGDGRVVVLGGHFDTVADVAGANDNGSGIATLLTLARELSGREFPFALRLIAFGAEESGLSGSIHYVSSLSESEQADVIAMLNFDVPGSGETIEALGSPELVSEALAIALANDLNVTEGSPADGAGSDHMSFASVEIPVLFVLADDLSRIHTPQDDLEFVEPELMGTAVALGLAVLESLAAR